jgi:hypothetical protein
VTTEPNPGGTVGPEAVVVAEAEADFADVLGTASKASTV